MIKTTFKIFLLVAISLSFTSCNNTNYEKSYLIEKFEDITLNESDITYSAYFTKNGVCYGLKHKSATVAVVPFEEGEYSGDIIIPDFVDYNGKKYPVQIIEANTFRGCKNLKSVTIGRNIQIIGSNAFESSNLKNIEIPEALQVIGSGAFKNCDNFENLTISYVQVIGDNAFSNCDRIRSIAVHNVQVIGADAFKGCSTLKDVVLKDVQVVGAGAFGNCNKINEIILDNVAVIGANAFADAKKICKLKLNDVDVVGNSAFRGMRTLIIK